MDKNSVYELYSLDNKIAVGNSDYIINALGMAEGIDTNDKKSMKTIKARFYEFANGQRTQWKTYKIVTVKLNSEVRKLFRILLKPYYNLPEYLSHANVKEYINLTMEALEVIDEYVTFHNMVIEMDIIKNLKEILPALYFDLPEDYNPFAMTKGDEPLGFIYYGKDENGKDIYEMERLPLTDEILNAGPLNYLQMRRLNKIRTQYQLRDAGDMTGSFKVNFTRGYYAYYYRTVDRIIRYVATIFCLDENLMEYHAEAFEVEEYKEEPSPKRERDLRLLKLLEQMNACETQEELEEFCNTSAEYARVLAEITNE